MKRFFLFAGEPSGDLHGGRLVRALKERFPTSAFAGVAGPRMRREGIEALLPMEAFEVMGFTDVLASLPQLWKQFYQVRNAILKNAYDVVVLIDYPGFNLRLARSLRKRGFAGKIVQYICPSVWAHGRGRIGQMAATLDLLLTIYPFEADYFSDVPLPVSYVGNPLQEQLEAQRLNPGWREAVGLDAGAEFVALFPGSREGEIVRNLPTHVEAARALKESFPSLRFAVSCAHDKSKGLIAGSLERAGLVAGKDVAVVPKEYTIEMMSECRTAIAKSGTVTLELALRQKPTVVTYQLTPLNKLIAKYVMRVDLPHYCIVNILGKQSIFPEFIDTKLPGNLIAEQLHQLHADGRRREECLAQCRSIQDLLGPRAASEEAAAAIGNLLR